MKKRNKKILLKNETIELIKEQLLYYKLKRNRASKILKIRPATLSDFLNYKTDLATSKFLELLQLTGLKIVKEGE